jgi:hypothetical protein
MDCSKRECIQDFSQPEVKRPFGHRREDNIKKGLKEMGCEVVD